MKIQKGIVKYRDRNDIVCTYGITDDGIQYYFLDETDSKKLSNGNRIVTTALVEAIDPMAKCSNIGVIDSDGSVVIACGNRSIKEINDELLLVETAQPTSLSVVEAINLKNDPLSAAKLVSTPAAIKDKLNSYIGSEGKYLFNDQFSEATVCDINGNNLLNGESFSFVVMANDKLYLSKNVPEESIVEFDLKEKTIVNNGMIDVSTAVVDQNVVEGALASGEGLPALDAVPTTTEEVAAPVASEEVTVPSEVADAVDFTIPVTDSITPDSSTDERVIIPYDEENTTIDFQKLDPTAVEETTATDTVETLPAIEGESTNEMSDDLKAFSDGAPSDDNGFVIPETMDEGMPIATDEQEDIAGAVIPDLGEDIVKDDSIPGLNTELPIVDDVEDKKEDAPVVPVLGEEPAEETTEEVAFNDNVMSQHVTPINPSDVAMAVDKDKNGINDSDEHTIDTHFDSFDMSPISSLDSKNDGLGSYDFPLSMGHSYVDLPDLSDHTSSLFSSTGYGSYGGGADNIMGDVVKSMQELMKQNKDQRALINRYREQMSTIESQSRLLADKYKDQAMRVENLTGRLRSMDEVTTRLESKNQLLESRVRDQDKIIASQERELKALRPQLESKQDLVRLLADAQSLIGSDYSYEDDTKYYGRVA